VPPPSSVNVVAGKWVFRHKFLSDGSLDRYKARWVLHGFTRRLGIDYDESFSPVIKPATIRAILTLALSRSWPIHQLDVKNVFLYGTLTEIVYCVQPTGFVDSSRPDYVCRLNKSLYGLKQAPRVWHSRFASHITSLSFVEAKSDTSLFIYCQGADMAFLLLYVDEIVLMVSSTSFLRRIILAGACTAPGVASRQPCTAPGVASRQPIMSRLTCISSENESPSVKSASCTFPLHPSTSTSSPKVCRHPSSRSLGACSPSL
jgi:hypothetical protein